MKQQKEFKKTSALLSLFITCSFIVFTGCAQQFSEVIDKQVAGLNGGFEFSQGGTPYNWQVYTQKTTQSGEFVIEVDTLDFAEGEQSLKFNVKSCAAKGGRFSPGIAQEMAVIAKETYKVSYRIKNKNAEYKISVNAVSVFNKSSGPTTTSKQDIDEWRSFEQFVKIPVGMDRLRFELNILSPGIFWIDDVTIKLVESDSTK